MLDEEMYVLKRDGEEQIVSFDKILKRIKNVGQGQVNLDQVCSLPDQGSKPDQGLLDPLTKINYTTLAMKVIDQLYNKITTTQIDELTAEQCASLASTHPDYNTLAGRITVSNHHKNTSSSFSHVMERLYQYRDKQDQHAPIVSKELIGTVRANAADLDKLCDYSRDYLIEYFGFKTLDKSYLMKINKQTVERPQHMWLRVSIGIHTKKTGEYNMDRIKETYEYMSKKYFTHATPTLFNAGTPRPQCSSCFLLAMESDSVTGIYDTLKDCALISKWAGGIGLHIHNIRASGSHIRGTNGQSNGLVPMLRVFNNTAKFINQSGKRNGSFAIYLEPWHADVEMFLQMRKNHGDEELKARDLFYALWIPDLFMERVKSDQTWTLMCPDECPGLADVHSGQFVELYERYEREGRGRKTMKARDLWFQMMDAQMETGTPYMLYKDAANTKSNQQNVGTIKSSNLCVAPETVILTDKGHIEISLLENRQVRVWNGQEFSEVTVKKTGIQQPLIEVHCDDGSILHCTPYHRFFIQGNTTIGTELSAPIIIEARNLAPGDVIQSCVFPTIDGPDKIDNAWQYGYDMGRGIEDITFDFDHMELSLSSKLQWFAGFFEGTLVNITNGVIHISHPDRGLLLDVKRMLQTCGVNTSVHYPRDLLPIYDMNRQDPAPNSYLELLSDQLSALQAQGLTYPKMDLSCFCDRDQTKGQAQGHNRDKTKGHNRDKTKGQAQEQVKVSQVVDNDRIDDTYCFTEPLRNAGIFNGILTSQCSEIIEYSDENETAVCNLASIALPAYIETDPMTNQAIFNYTKLHEVTKLVTYNLNQIIDINYYPTEKTERSNRRHRPIGIGVQGLADTFMMMDLPFASDEAKEMNKSIFETMYHAALEQSCEMAQVDGAYETFVGSPAQMGKLQFDLWNDLPKVNQHNDLPINQHNDLSKVNQHNDLPTNQEPENIPKATPQQSSSDLPYTNQHQYDHATQRYDWLALKTRIQKHGLRNSLLLAPMPTASTSQILGYNECIEPITSNIYSRRTIAGEFILANQYLMKDLLHLNLWNEKMKNNIIANNGSIQHIDAIPANIREKYKTVWEIPMKQLIDMAADRGVYICQSQSLNLWIEDPNYNTLTSMHFYAWKKGLKTGIYYLRRRGKHQAQQFTIEPTQKKAIKEDEPCEMCSA